MVRLCRSCKKKFSVKYEIFRILILSNLYFPTYVITIFCFFHVNRKCKKDDGDIGEYLSICWIFCNARPLKMKVQFELYFIVSNENITTNLQCKHRCKHSMQAQGEVNPLRANLAEILNTLKQFVGNNRQIVWVCLTIFRVGA